MFRGRVDKVPALTLSSVVTLEMMEAVDAWFPEAHLDAEKMARLAATSHDILGMDTIMPVFHSQLEAHAMGAPTEWAEKDNWPSTSAYTVDDPDVLLEPWTQGTLAVRLLPATGRVVEADPCVVIPPGGDPYLRG